MAKFSAKIRIKLREGILDVQGKTVEHSLHSLGYNNLSSMKIGKYVELNVEGSDYDSAYKSVESACKELIANPIIEDYFIELNAAE